MPTYTEKALNTESMRYVLALFLITIIILIQSLAFLLGMEELTLINVSVYLGWWILAMMFLWRYIPTPERITIEESGMMVSPPKQGKLIKFADIKEVFETRTFFWPGLYLYPKESGETIRISPPAYGRDYEEIKRLITENPNFKAKTIHKHWFQKF
ncbi:MAG: hypothetical protein ABH950_01915 [Candidatus Altiarchaeota archaeon]